MKVLFTWSVLVVTISLACKNTEIDSDSNLLTDQNMQSKNPCERSMFVRDANWLGCVYTPENWKEFDPSKNPEWRSEDRQKGGYEDVEKFDPDTTRAYIGVERFASKKALNDFVKEFIHVNACENCGISDKVKNVKDFESWIQEEKWKNTDRWKLIKKENKLISGRWKSLVDELGTDGKTPPLFKISKVKDKDNKTWKVYSKYRGMLLGVGEDGDFFFWAEGEESYFDDAPPSESILNYIDSEKNPEYRIDLILKTLRIHGQAEGKYPKYRKKEGNWSSKLKGEDNEPVRDVYCYVSKDLKAKCSWADQT